MKGECIIDIGFVNLRTSNSGRHDRKDYVNGKQYGHDVIDMRRVGDGRYLQLGITLYKFVLDT